MHFLTPQEAKFLHKLHYTPDVKNKTRTLTACAYIAKFTKFSFEVKWLLQYISYQHFFYISRSVLLEKAGFARDNQPRYLPSCVRYIYSP